MGSVTRFFLGSHKSYFIFGPRGTGKSTWLKDTYPNSLKIDLLDPETFRQFRAYPERLQQAVATLSENAIVIIDEIQKAPILLDVVHTLIEANKNYQFILTGSSARKLKREGVDLLAGRAHLKYMHPFMAAELGSKFSITHALEYGMLPLLYGSLDPKADLHAYLALYMKEEVLLEGLIRQVDEFSRFLEVISFSQGAILNFSNIARECQISSKTVENYVSILEDLLLAFLVPVFTKKAQRHLIAKPKFYYFDAGVYQSIRPKGPLDYPQEIRGIALETLVAQHLRAWLAYSNKKGELYFWRTKNGLEVDFIIYGEIGFYAIEVKHNKFIHSKDLRALKEFSMDYPEAHCILLYQGEMQLIRDNIKCYPIAEYLLSLKPS